MKITNKLYNIMAKNQLFLTLTAVLFLFISYALKYKVYSSTSDGYVIYFIAGLICLFFSNCIFFKNNALNLKNALINSIIYCVFFISFSWVFFLIFWFLTPSFHEARFLIPFIALFLMPLGVHITTSDSFLSFIYNGETYKFAVSYEQNAFALFILISLTLFFYYIISNKKYILFFKQLIIIVFYFKVYNFNFYFCV